MAAAQHPTASTVYELTCTDASGALLVRELAAADEQQARAQAGAQGLAVLSCAPRAAAQALAPRLLPADVVGNFARDLAVLLESGLGVLDALNTLIQAAPRGDLRAAVMELHGLLKRGLRVSQGLQEVGMFPPLLVAFASVSEQTGDLAQALDRYARQQQALGDLRRKMISSLTYPTLLIVVGTMVVLFLLGFVVPQFGLLMQEAPVGTQGSTFIALWSDFVHRRPWAAALLGGAVIAAMAVCGLQLARHGLRARWIARVPRVRTLARQFQHAQFYRTLGLLIAGGMPLVRALQMAQDLLNEADRERLQQCIAAVAAGKPLNQTLAEADLADPVAASLLAVSDRTGTLPEALERIAHFHDQTLERAIDAAMRLFEPLLMIFIGLVIGTIVILMYMPIFDLAAGLQ